MSSASGILISHSKRRCSNCRDCTLDRSANASAGRRTSSSRIEPNADRVICSVITSGSSSGTRSRSPRSAMARRPETRQSVSGRRPKSSFSSMAQDSVGVQAQSQGSPNHPPAEQKSVMCTLAGSGGEHWHTLRRQCSWCPLSSATGTHIGAPHTGRGAA